MQYSLKKERMRNIEGYFQHPSYSLEKKLLNEIRMGMADQAKSTLDVINSTDRARLSRNSLRSLKNSMIISCALFARSVLETGIDPEDVFTLSDIFIGHIEEMGSEAELNKFEYEMVAEYIRLVNQSEIYNLSQPVSAVINYIHDHLSDNLTVSDLASLIHKSPDYLSRLFKKEMGMNLTSYIQIHKVQLAQYFLEYTEMKIIDIAILLNFCNQGYFSSSFKKYTGYTPSDYRINKAECVADNIVGEGISDDEQR